MPFKKLEHTKVRMLPLVNRNNKMTVRDIQAIGYTVTQLSPALEFDLRELADRIIKARGDSKPVIWLMGAHVLRSGNSRFVIDLLERGIITHLATNGAVAIHDFELAFLGATLEDVEYYIKNGRFGNWDETGRYINQAISRAARDGIGFGEAIGKLIQQEECVSTVLYKEISIFAAAFRLGVPITVHKSIGQDITDQHPSADFAALGKTSGDDFLIFANSIAGLEGGVFLNLGSQVMGPEVYLKALSMARNIASQKGESIAKFTTAVFDLVNLGDWRSENLTNYKNPGTMSDARYYFRPLKTVLIRTVKDGGESFYIPGDFNQTIRSLYQCINTASARSR